MNVLNKLSKIKNDYYKKIKYKKDFWNFRQKDLKKRFDVDWNQRYPCLNDNTEYTSFDSHYVYHPAWAARIIKQINPSVHVDVSSTLHFCSLLSAFIPVEFYDYRPANLTLDNLYMGKADLLNLHFKSNSIYSLSCMHTIEHIGLGRYGDTIEPDGDLLAIKELKRVCAVNGNLLFVVPVSGNPRIIFNAHRIYNSQMIMDYFEDFQLMEFSLITDKGEFIKNSKLNNADNQKYGCGCFWFSKKNT